MLLFLGRMETPGRAFAHRFSIMIARFTASRLCRADIRTALRAGLKIKMIEGVLVDNIVFEKMARCSRRFSPLEAGGLVLGYRKNTYLHAIDVTLPGPWDKHSRSSFHRSPRAHRLRALRLWRKSGGLIDWIGEWHSHPSFSLSPSSTDHRNWKRLVRHRKAAMIFPICDGRECELFLQARFQIGPHKLAAFECDNLGTFFNVA